MLLQFSVILYQKLAYMGNKCLFIPTIILDISLSLFSPVSGNNISNFISIYYNIKKIYQPLHNGQKIMVNALGYIIFNDIENTLSR